MTFSIIIPCYKVEKYIRECLDSVLAQSMQDWEAICVDDGSPDITGVILDEYAARDSRIKVMHQVNGGLSAARNAALRVAKGEWLYYLDSDDVIAPHALMTYFQLIQKYPDADMIKAGMVKFVDGDNFIWPSYEDGITIYDLDKEICSYGCGYFVQIVYRRGVFGNILFTGMSWSEERLYFAQCLAVASKGVEVSTPCYGYRVREGSITQCPITIDEFKGSLAANRKILDIYVRTGKKINIRVVRALMNIWFEFGSWSAHRDFRGKERKAAWEAWFHSIDEFVVGYKPMPIWRSFTVYICWKLPFRPIAFVLCCIPTWLKLHGVHR